MLSSKQTAMTFILLFVIAGCTGSEIAPNNATQTGAAVGALTGAVVGYNTTGHYKGQRAAIGAVAGAATGALIGNAIDESQPQVIETGGWQE